MAQQSRISVLKAVLWDRWWAKAAYVLWAALTSYDTLSGAVSQVLPDYELIPLGALFGRSNVMPWWGWLLVLQSLLQVLTLVYLVEHTTQVEQPIPGPEPTGFTDADQLALVQTLRRLRGDGSEPHRAKVVFGGSAQAALARRLADLFERAGWERAFNETPQEPWKSSFPPGARVSGFNGALVDAVAAALVAAGIREVHQELRQLEVPRDNPKFPTAINTIYLSLGPSGAIIV